MDTYQDLLAYERPVSSAHAPMRRRDRAAQFAPFAALSGFGEVLWEAGRLTQPRTELDESEREALNRVLCMLAERLSARPEVHVRWFEPDAQKSGGVYCETRCRVRTLDPYAHVLLLEDGTRIPFDALAALDL